MEIKNENEISALYYPYPTPQNINNMKKALLVFNHIYFILPTYEDTYHGLGIERAPSKSFTEMHIVMEEYVDREIFKIIRPADTVKEYAEFMLPALEEDQQDQQFMKESNNADWLIYQEKIPDLMENVIKRVGHREGNAIRLPFVLGESIMISHAVYACHSKQKEGESISPITDDRLHRNLLVRRLNRGVENMKSKIQQYEIPKIKNAIDMYIPEPRSIQQIIDIRTTHEKPLSKIRAGMKILANIMRNPNDPQYSEKIRMINDELKPVYNELGLTNTPKQVVKLRREVPDDYTPSRREVIGTNRDMVFGLGKTTLREIPDLRYGVISAYETQSRDVSFEIDHLPNTSTDFQLAV